MRKTLHTTIIFSIFTLIISSCQRDIDTTLPPPDKKVSASLSGTVFDVNKQPIAGAVVVAGGVNTLTDENGNFAISNASLSQEAAIVTAKMEGYFNNVRNLVLSNEGTQHVEIQLAKADVAGTVNSSSGGTVNVGTGAAIKLETGNFKNTAANGNYQGTVSIVSTFINPDADNFASLVPGNLRGIDKNGKEVGLQSFGVLAVELKGSADEHLQLTQQATITIPIPASKQAGAAETIGLWYFDETKGFWINEGTATREGNSYVGKVSHFSFWTVNEGYDVINLQATIKDNEGRLFANAPISIRAYSTATTYEVRTGYTNSKGELNCKVPANKSLMLRGCNNCGLLVFSKDIGLHNADFDYGTITFTDTTGIYVSFKGQVTDCNNAPVSRGLVNIKMGYTVYRLQTSGNGLYDTTFYFCSKSGATDVNISAVDVATTQSSATVTKTLTTQTEIVQNLVACSDDEGQSVSFTLNSDTKNFYPVDYIYFHVSAYAVDSTMLSAGNNVNMIFMEFATPTEVGVKPLKNFSILANGVSYKMAPSGINATITTMGASKNEYVIGTFSGSVIKPDNSQTYPIEGQFKIKRTN